MISELEDLTKAISKARQERDFWKEAAFDSRRKSDEVELELAAALRCHEDRQQQVNDKKMSIARKSEKSFIEGHFISIRTKTLELEEWA